ncbi:MAG: hypothetical protein RIS76_941 [Verrucomicrobiota bacterium]
MKTRNAGLPTPAPAPTPAPTFTELPLQRLSNQASAALTAYRQALLEALSATDAGDLPVNLLSQALNEAEALATLTPFPALFLPALAEEKITDARIWFERQRQIREQEFALTA